MKVIYKYKILKEQKLIIQFHQGSTTSNELKLVKSHISEDKDFNPAYKFLVDLRYSYFNVNPREMTNYGIWLSENTELHQNSIKVILTNTPNQVVRSMVFGNTNGMKEFGFTIFTNLDESLNHLQIDVNNYKMVEREIEKMTEK